jgi:hypothetical protein
MKRSFMRCFKELNDFIFVDPQIPDFNKNYVSTKRLSITPEDSREKIMNLITVNADKSEQALIALYVYRQMDKIEWLPFIKAAIERNPVCFTDLNGKSIKEVYDLLRSFPDESIYDGKRLALPDEVWNFRRGDGIEKALLLADFLLHRDSSASVSIGIENKKVLISSNGMDFHFASHKNFRKSIQISGKDYSIV